MKSLAHFPRILLFNPNPRRPKSPHLRSRRWGFFLPFEHAIRYSNFLSVGSHPPRDAFFSARATNRPISLKPYACGLIPEGKPPAVFWRDVRAGKYEVVKERGFFSGTRAV